MEAGSGFEQNFFDAITGSLQGAGDFWVEGRSFGKATDAFEEEGSAFVLPLRAGSFAWDGLIEFCGAIRHKF